jgi:hypothetical protein
LFLPVVIIVVNQKLTSLAFRLCFTTPADHYLASA